MIMYILACMHWLMRTSRTLHITYKVKMTTYLTLYKICLKNIKVVFNRKRKKWCFQVDRELRLIARSSNERCFIFSTCIYFHFLHLWNFMTVMINTLSLSFILEIVIYFLQVFFKHDPKMRLKTGLSDSLTADLCVVNQIP